MKPVSYISLVYKTEDRGPKTEARVV